ncbi:MAG TPA: PAS domain S-box protein, partial [Allocoleopsis sp.]
TERKRVEASLRHTEAKNRALISALPDLIMRMSEDGTYLDFFPTETFKVFGDQNLVGARIYERGLPLELAQLRMQYIQQAFQTGELQLYEQKIAVDGKIQTEEVRIVVCGAQEVLVIVRDITDRKNAEDALRQLNQELESRIEQRTLELRQSEARFRQIFEQSPLGIAISDLEGHLTRVNSSLVEIVGYSQAELLQRSIQDIISVDRQQQGMQRLQQLLEQTLSVITFESQLVSGHGEPVWVNVTSALIFNGFARPAAIVHLIENVSERKRGEAEQKRAEAELRHTLKELSDFKYALDEAAMVAITDATGKITYANDRFCEIAQYSREELIGNTHHLLNSSYHSQQFFTGMWKTISLGKTWRGEIQNRSKDGTCHWLDTTIIPFLDQHNQPIQYLTIRTDITARKQAELHAKFLKERLQFLLSSSPAVIYTCSTTGDYGATSISENVKTLLGYEPDEFLADPDFWANHIHPQDRARVFAELPLLFEQEHYCHEYRFLHQDGTYRWMRDELRLIREGAQSPLEIIGYFADISDLKQVELELQELTVSLQNAMEGISRLDKQGCYLTLNRAYAKLSACEPEALVGTTWQNTVYPEDIPLMEAAYQTMLERGKVEAEARGIRKDGSWFYKQITMVMALDQAGQFDGHYCFVKDISDRKTAEEALKRQLEAIEAAIDGIAILTGDTFTYLNQAHLELFGYQYSEELLGKSWTVLYSQEELRRFEQEVFPVLSQHRSWQGEAIATRKDGSTFSEGLSLTLAESGELICVCRDITAKKAVEEQLRDANDQLRIANAGLARATQLKDEFLANMSHELRTPLNAILGMSEGLQEEVFGSISDRQKQAILTIERSGKHLLELINDILDLSKTESGKLELQIAPIAISYLCESSLAFVRQQAIQKNIQLLSVVPPSLPNIAIDERRIRQVLINLLSNAVKFTPNGGRVKLEVHIEHQQDQNFLLFSVMDTGIGIAPENIDQLFQPFVQIDSRLNRQYTGTGLGLALVRRLTELHGGTVTVSSMSGQGSCFTVRLPCTCLSSTGCLPAAPAKQHGILSFEPTKALIIEDSIVAAEQITRYLSELEIETVILSQGEGAIDAVIHHEPALVILDLQLPDLSGWNVLHQLKTHPHTQHIPVIVISVVDERSRGLSLGAAEYLIKPIDRQQLYGVLRQLHPSSAPPALQPDQPHASSNRGIVTPLILLAEDNEASVVTISSYLKARGYGLVLAKNGKEAIHLAKTHAPDLILMDIQMPETDGLEAIRKIRADLQVANVPIIALTALAMPSDREKCMAAGANDYLPKPVKLKPLVETIQMLLDRS